MLGVVTARYLKLDFAAGSGVLIKRLQGRFGMRCKVHTPSNASTGLLGKSSEGTKLTLFWSTFGALACF